MAPSPSSRTMANGLLPLDHLFSITHKLGRKLKQTAYRRLAQTHKFGLSNFSSIVPNTARLDFILEVAALFLIAGLQFLILLDEVGDKGLTLSVRLAESFEAL